MWVHDVIKVHFCQQIKQLYSVFDRESFKFGDKVEEIEVENVEEECDLVCDLNLFDEGLQQDIDRDCVDLLENRNKIVQAKLSHWRIHVVFYGGEG